MASLRSRLTLEPWLAAAAVAGLTLYYCLRNGMYDLVERGEMGLLIWVALGLGWATGVLPRERPAKVLWPVVAGFLALGVWSTICLRWTESDERTVIEIGRVAHHAGFFLLAASLLTRNSWRGALGGLTAGLVIVAWLGLCNWLWPGSIAVDYTRKVFGVNRLSYPLAYFNGMATLGAMTIVAGLAWATHAPRWWLRALAILPIPGVAVMAYLTYSRGGAIELAAGLVVVLAFARSRVPTLIVGLVTAAGSALTILALRDHQDLVEGAGSAGAGQILGYAIAAGLVAAAVTIALSAVRADERLRAPERIGRPALVAALVLAVVAAGVAAPTVIRKAGRSFGGAQVNSADNPTARFTTLGSAREPQFKSALDTFKDHPTEGSGPGTYEFTWNRDPRYGSFVRDVHNLYLEALSESGWPGLLATIIALGAVAVAIVLAALRATGPAQRGAATAAAGVFAVFLVAAALDWVWELTALSAAALLAGGAALASLSSEASLRRLRPGRVAVPLAAVAAVVAILPAAVSRSEVRASQASARAGEPAEALRHATDAIDTAPWSASAIAQKGLLLEDAGELRDAEGYIALAMTREPTNWRYPLIRARIRAERGDPKGAVRFFRRARALAPLKAALQ